MLSKAIDMYIYVLFMCKILGYILNITITFDLAIRFPKAVALKSFWLKGSLLSNTTFKGKK